MELYQKVSVVGQSLLVVLAVLSCIIDFLYHPELEGNAYNLGNGVLVVLISIYLCWASQRDAEKGNSKDHEFVSLREQFEKSKMSKQNALSLGLLGSRRSLQGVYRLLFPPELYVHTDS